MVDANACRTRNEMRKVALGVIGTIPLTFVTDDMPDLVPLTSSWTDPSRGDTGMGFGARSDVPWSANSSGNLGTLNLHRWDEELIRLATMTTGAS